MNNRYHFNFFDFFEVSGKTKLQFFIACLLIPILLGVSYLITAGLSFGFCWGFSLPWSWKIAFGVWCGAIGLAWLFKKPKNNA